MYVCKIKNAFLFKLILFKENNFFLIHMLELIFMIYRRAQNEIFINLFRLNVFIHAFALCQDE